MPAESKAQAEKMYFLYKEGKITKQQLDDWDKGLKEKNLPQHVPKKK